MESVVLDSDDAYTFGEGFSKWTQSPDSRWRGIDHQSWDDDDIAYVMRRIRSPPHNRLLTVERSDPSRVALGAAFDEQGIGTQVKRQHVLNRLVKSTPVFLGLSLTERDRNALVIAMPPRDPNARLIAHPWKWYEVVPSSKRERVVNAVFTDLRSGGFRATDSLWELIRTHLIGISRSYVDAIIKKHELRQIQNLPPQVVNPIRSQWPNERWQIDMFVLRDTRHKDRRFFYIAVIIDHFSKYVWTKWVKKLPGHGSMTVDNERFERHKYIFDWIATDLEMLKFRDSVGNRGQTRSTFGPDKVNASAVDGNPNLRDELRVPGAHGRPNILQGDNEFNPVRSEHTVNWCLGTNINKPAQQRSPRKLSAYHGPRVQLVNSLPYQPKTNGLVERVNGTLKKMMRSWLYTTDTSIQLTPSIFEQALCDITRTYNSTKHSTIGFAPFEVYFGRPDQKIVENFHRRVRTFDNDEVTQITNPTAPAAESATAPGPAGRPPDAQLLRALSTVQPRDLVTVHDLYGALSNAYKDLYGVALPNHGTTAALEIITQLPGLVRQSDLPNQDEWMHVWPVKDTDGAAAAALSGGAGPVILKCPQNRREVFHNLMGDPHSQPSAENAVKQASPGCSVFNWKFNPNNPNLHREICNYARWGINLGAEKMLKHTEAKLKKQQQVSARGLEIEIGTVVRLLKSKSEKFEKDGRSDSTEGKNWRKAHKGDGTITSQENLDEIERRSKTTFYWTRELYVVIEVMRDVRDQMELEDVTETEQRMAQNNPLPAPHPGRVGIEPASRQSLVRHADMRAPAGRQGRQLTVYDKRTPLAVKLATRYRLAPLDESARPSNAQRYVHVSQTCIQSKRAVKQLQEQFAHAIEQDLPRAEIDEISKRLAKAKTEARRFNNYTSTMESVEIRNFNDGAVVGRALDDLIESYTRTPLKWCFYRTELWPMWPMKSRTAIPGYGAEEINVVRTYRFKNDQRSKSHNMQTRTEMEQQDILERIRLAKEKAGKKYPILIRRLKNSPTDNMAAIQLFKDTLAEMFNNQAVFKHTDPEPHTVGEITFESDDQNEIIDAIHLDKVLFSLRTAKRHVGVFERKKISFIEPVRKTGEGEASYAPVVRAAPAAG